jgi:2-polyprenyl-3-methyl-5-hydroxy-6-metoxy-1,4-benzoquinol methylase
MPARRSLAIRADKPLETTNCNLCGANRPRRLYRIFDRDISQCGSCGLVYAGPLRLTREETWGRYSATYFHDEYLPSYGITNGHVDLAAFDARYARTLASLRPFRQRGDLIEIGCAAGFFLKSAERDGWNVTGLELMQPAVEFARERLGLTVLQKAVEDADLPVGAFDVVAIFEVIEHLSNPVATLRQLRTLLRPGGALVLSTPNMSSLSRHMLGRHWAVLNPGEHLQYFNERTLADALGRAGFTGVQFDRHYAGLGVYETMAPRHSFDRSPLRARLYTGIVDVAGVFLRAPVQALGLADGLHCLARNPS